MEVTTAALLAFWVTVYYGLQIQNVYFYTKKYCQQSQLSWHFSISGTLKLCVCAFYTQLTDLRLQHGKE